MSRLRISMENEENVNVDSTEVDNTVAENEALNNETEQLQSENEELLEVNDIQESVTDISEQLENSIKEDGEGISPETAAIVEIATEHFSKRLGISKKLIPAKEGFTDIASRKQTTLKALENLKLLQTNIDKGLSVAEEGFVENIKTSVEMAFTTEEKIQRRILELKQLYKNNKPKNTEFVNGSWIKYLPSTSKDFSGKEAIKILQDTLKATKSVDFATSLKSLISGLTKLTTEVRGNWFVSNKNDIKRIKDIGTKLDVEVDKIKNDNAILAKANNKSVVCTPATEAEALKIISLIDELINSVSLEPLIKELASKSGSLKLWSYIQNIFRLKSNAVSMIAPVKGVIPIINSFSNELSFFDKLSPEDLVEAKKAALSSRNILVHMKTISTDRLKMCNALLSYLNDSID